MTFDSKLGVYQLPRENPFNFFQSIRASKYIHQIGLQLCNVECVKTLIPIGLMKIDNLVKTIDFTSIVSTSTTSRYYSNKIFGI